MNLPEDDFDDLDRLMALALQKEGLLIPSDIDLDDLEIEEGQPESEESISRAVEAILHPSKMDSAPVVATFRPFSSTNLDEYARAARHGERLSPETMEKLKKISNSVPNKNG